MCLDANNRIKFVTHSHCNYTDSYKYYTDKICYPLYIFMYIHVYKCIFLHRLDALPRFYFFSYFNVNLLLTVISYVRLKSLTLHIFARNACKPSKRV